MAAFNPLVREVKLMGQNQMPGWNPSGAPAFMYQAQAQPSPVTTPMAPPAVAAPAPAPAPAAPAAAPTPPPAPSRAINTDYVAGGIAILAFVGALLIPSRGR